VTPGAGAVVPQLPAPSQTPPLQGVPWTAGAHVPEPSSHWLDTHSVPPHFGVPTQPPKAHVSEPGKTQRFPSEHKVPSGAAGVEHFPLAGLHVPATWHWSAAEHATIVPGVQTPASQASLESHAFPSLQGVPSDADGFEQRPDPRSQAPTVWHWSAAVHVTGLDPVHVPPWQASDRVQASPSLQLVPSTAFGFEQAPVD
jgi:hypothetical protein